MMQGERLLRWARGVYGAWHDQRHGARELPEELLANVYLQGAIDVLKDETARHIQKGQEDAERLAGYRTVDRETPGRGRRGDDRV
jgi:hypothetical protein